MKLRWRPSANLDRVAIYDYIEEDSPAAASAVDERILQAVDNLIRFPALGHLGRRKGSRELVIRRTPYVAYYRIVGETVETFETCMVPGAGRNSMIYKQKPGSANFYP